MKIEHFEKYSTNVEQILTYLQIACSYVIKNISNNITRILNKLHQKTFINIKFTVTDTITTYKFSKRKKKKL